MWRRVGRFSATPRFEVRACGSQLFPPSKGRVWSESLILHRLYLKQTWCADLDAALYEAAVQFTLLPQV
jgi:hypothetical protein